MGNAGRLPTVGFGHMGVPEVSQDKVDVPEFAALCRERSLAAIRRWTLPKWLSRSVYRLRGNRNGSAVTKIPRDRNWSLDPSIASILGIKATIQCLTQTMPDPAAKLEPTSGSALPLRVGIITSSFPVPSNPSSGIFVERLVAHLPDSIQATVLTPCPDSALPRPKGRAYSLTCFNYGPRRWLRLAHRPGGHAGCMAEA
jgi:hypothetical protein